MANRCLISMVFTLIFVMINIVKGQNNTLNPTDIECTGSIECSSRGECIQDLDLTSQDICLCDDGYTTFDAEEDIYCNYKQKEQFTAFLLTFFLGGVGAGRFYLEDYLLAGLKLGLCFGLPYIICYIMCFCGMCSGIKDDFGNDGLFAATGCIGCCLICIYVLGVMGWCIADIVLIGIGDAKDGNGVEIYQNLQ